MAKRRNYSPDFKARVALAALTNEKTVAELSAEFGIHQNLVNKWKAQLKDSAANVFAGVGCSGVPQLAAMLAAP